MIHMYLYVYELKMIKCSPPYLCSVSKSVFDFTGLKVVDWATSEVLLAAF